MLPEERVQVKMNKQAENYVRSPQNWYGLWYSI